MQTPPPSSGGRALPALRPTASVPPGSALPVPSNHYETPLFVEQAAPPPAAEAKRALHEWRDLVRRGRWLILGTLLLSLGLGVAYVMLKTPTYNAHSVLLVNTQTPARAQGTVSPPAATGSSGRRARS